MVAEVKGRNTLNSELLHGFHLGDLYIDPVRGQVTGRDRSEHLPPKAAEVLLCLARRSGDLVTRDELLQTVWGADHGSQEALGHAISEIRHALGDYPDNPLFIQTLPKRGFRLLVDPVLAGAESTPTEAETGPARLWKLMLRHGVVQASAAYLVVGWLLIQVADATFAEIGLPSWSQQFLTFVVIWGLPLVVLLTWFLEFAKGRLERDRGQQTGGLFQGLERNYLAIFIAYGMSAIGVGIYQSLIGFEVMQQPQVFVSENNEEFVPIPVVANSLAALKLLNIDGDAKAQAFTDGVSEDILDGLARIPGLFVSARGDSWSMPPNATSKEVRRRLRVANYIEGSIRFFGDKLLVVVQLIDSDTGFHIFSRNFELEVAAVNDMQKEIAELVVANLKLAVDPAALELDGLFMTAPNNDAYYLYQLGREALNRPATVANFNEAVANFDAALQIDDEYPAALAGRCRAFSALYDLQDDTQNIALAENACARAISVAPRLPMVLTTVANLYLETGRQSEAESMFQLALDINAQDIAATEGIAAIRRREQRYDEAESLMRRAITLQPGNWRSINTLGNLYFRMGRFNEAAMEYVKVVYLDPQNYVTLGNLASVSMMIGDFPAAINALEESIAIEDNATFQSNLGIAHYYLGSFEQAVAALRRAVELAPNSSGNWIGLADALHFSGDVHAANNAYQKGMDLARLQIGVNQEDTESLTNLAWSAAMLEQLEEAAAHAKQAVALDPADPYSHYFAGLVSLKRGQSSEAVDSLTLAVDNGYPVAMLAAEPILEELQEDPRFASLLATAKN